MRDFGVDYTDFGARFYSPRVRRWLTPDPLSEKYYGTSPYAYCNGNPINFVDPDGRRPIYNAHGELVGVTESGLQGDPVFITDYTEYHTMTDDQAEAMNEGADVLDEDAFAIFVKSYNTLRERPDWDGYITLSEANEWYRNGNGADLFADLSKIDFSRLSPLEVGEERNISLFSESKKIMDMLVYGSIKIVGYPNNQIRAYSDTYDFDMHPSSSLRTKTRNSITKIGSIIAGKGEKYYINFYGFKRL